MLLIYTDLLTPRLEFTFRLFFGSLVRTPYGLTQDREQFVNYTGPRFSYGKEPLENELFQQASGLLFEQGVREHEPEADASGKGFYPVSSGVFGFDLFAAAFFLVSRYEEYYTVTPDEHGRYKAEYSYAFRKGFLERPVVNAWAEELKGKLEERFPEITFEENTFSFLSTFDIDVAFAYASRSLLRTAGGYARSLLSGDLRDVRQRAAVLLGRRDPYDTFDLMKELHDRYGYRQVTFFLLGDYGPYDKNIDVEKSDKLRRTILEVSGYSEVGVHPSYRSGSAANAMAVETGRLERVLGKPVRKSRQHFLRFRLPETYRQLIRQGIREEYTMGYASAPGFRAGICTPFPFYDLSSETPTDLLVHPFQVMDGTLKDYMKLSPDEAIRKALLLIEEVRKVKGTFVLLWHNHSLSDTGEWKGWRSVYERIVKQASTTR